MRPPKKLEDLTIPHGLVQDLTLRRALFEGRTSTLRLSDGLALSPTLMTQVIDELRELRLMEVLGLEGHNYIVSLTEQGREQANERMRQCRYAGAAPVILKEYREMVLAQTASPNIDRDVMRRAFSDLVVNDRLLDELGPGLISEGAMFLYGPPGTGKTSIAERLIRVHDDSVLVPRAVEVDSQIIIVFDPIVHEPIDPQPEGLDPRWVLCKRPAIMAGGELTTSSLDLTHEAANGIYLAPLQMQANNGILVIDDFGRQTVSPEALLNRWIVPLDRRVDYLSLSYGMKFQIPFDTKVCFSTNLEPSHLGDEAFFRRIQNKILVPSISDEEFDEVLRRASAAMGVTVEEGTPEYLRKISRELGDGDLRPYLPREVCRILKSVCVYNSTPLILDNTNVDRVASVYFTKAAQRRRELIEAQLGVSPSRDTKAGATMPTL
jgi:predicted ATPase with chaperone activity